MTKAISLSGAHVGEGRGRGRQPCGQIPYPEHLERRHTEVAAKLCRGAPATPEAGIRERERCAGGLQSREELRRAPQRLR
jgi:hypothetical protein